MKIVNDKYYTPSWLASKCISTAFDIIGRDNISEIIEPSAGDGSFSLKMDCLSMDIEPEHDSITKADFLQYNPGYKPGRLIIGNPPYGEKMKLAIQFYDHSVMMADYIAFILSINQLDNIHSLYKFDLVYSEDLGVIEYSDRKTHNCFNIYRRPEYGLNRKPSPNLKDITIIRQDNKNYDDIQEDFRLCYWGDGSAGKIVTGKKYAGEYKIIVNNKDLLDTVRQIITEIDWKTETGSISAVRIMKHHLINALRRRIPEIK